MKNFYEITKIIDNLINQKPLKESKEKLLHIIRSDKSYERYFIEFLKMRGG